ncbi:MAG: flagellar hook-basal body complex protein FliE [Thermoclostridium sp.]|nr:flagellar hook-basal body complex protein FliE [Thermoclostridium sp.]
MSITGLQPIQQGLLVQGKNLQADQTSETSFRDILTQALQNVNKLEKESEAITSDFIAGKTDSIHSVLIAAEKASLAMDLVLEVRNKVLDAYTEIMRMQV